MFTADTVQLETMFNINNGGAGSDRKGHPRIQDTVGSPGLSVVGAVATAVSATAGSA